MDLPVTAKVRGGTYHKILKQCIAAFEVNIRPVRQVRSLLEKDRVGSIHLAHVNRHFLYRCVRSCHHHEQAQQKQTSFCAEKIEFMIGI